MDIPQEYAHFASDSELEIKICTMGIFMATYFICKIIETAVRKIV